MLIALFFAATALANEGDSEEKTGFLATLSTPPVEAQSDDLNVVNFGGDIVPFVGTSAYEADRTVRQLSLNLLGGYTYGLQGVEASAGVNIESGFVHGAQGAAVANINLGVLKGAQGAGAVNYAGLVEGVQGSGALNVSRTTVDGIQGSGGLNLAGGSVDGAQVSGGANVALDVDGVQATGGANLAVGELRGTQAAGGANVVVGDVQGVQAAGGLNVATGTVSGVQVAPLNVTVEEADVQIGVVNVGANADVGIGVFNLYWQGRNHVDVWADSQGFAYAGLKMGSRYIHNIYSVGVQAIGSEDSWTVGMGIGGHIPVAKRVAIDMDIMAHQAWQNTYLQCQRLDLLNQARAVLVLSPFENLGIYAGPTYDVRVTDSPQTLRVIGRPGLTAGVQLF